MRRWRYRHYFGDEVDHHCCFVGGRGERPGLVDIKGTTSVWLVLPSHPCERRLLACTVQAWAMWKTWFVPATPSYTK